MNQQEAEQQKAPLDRQRIPEPIFEANAHLVDVYWRAWELAWDYVVEREGAPQSPYMDEAFSPDIIWIWDTCFMVHFCKYAYDLFPGIQSFDNFYLPMHEGASISLKIQHPDNPPLFAWTEYAYYQFTGDEERLRHILIDKRYLQRHFDFIENNEPGTLYPYAKIATAIERRPPATAGPATPAGWTIRPAVAEATSVSYGWTRWRSRRSRPSTSPR